MAPIEIKSFDRPDETRPFEGRGRVELVTLNGQQIGKATFEPGWRWSQDVKPIAQTESCQVKHLGFVLSGRLRITMDDGSQAEIGPGDAFSVPAGHDAEVVGDEPCVTIDVGEEDADYAKRA
jgi:mannose-6-phosphate isomerase-like protein (cupin superfamily)